MDKVRQIMVFAIIGLFIGASVLTNVIGASVEKNDTIRYSMSLQRSNQLNYDDDYPKWSEHFENYETGSGIHGKGGWKGWNNDPSFDAYITEEYYHSPQRSLKVAGSTDIVREFEGFNIETYSSWVFRGYVFIPEDFEGESYFILLSDYKDGAGQSNKWALQLCFDGEKNIIESEFDSEKIPLIRGQWMDISISINLDIDIFICSINDITIVEKPWTATPKNDGSGKLNIAAINLYANGASPIYYDNMYMRISTVEFYVPPTPPVITGERTPKMGISYSYGFVSEDADGDPIWYQVDWGDGSRKVGFLGFGPFLSGQEATLMHNWNEAGTYFLNARATDFREGPSDLTRITIKVEDDSCCFPAGTRITMADGSCKNIEDVTHGDRVLSFDLETETYGSWMVKMLGSPVHPVYNINEGLISTTIDHPLFIKKSDGTIGIGAIDAHRASTVVVLHKYDTVLDIEIGDYLFSHEQGWIEITSITSSNEPVQTYNIMSFSGTRTYFADGILVYEEIDPNDVKPYLEIVMERFPGITRFLFSMPILMSIFNSNN